MQKKLVLAGVAVTALALSSGGALTASNTLDGDNVAGYGSSTVTGATVEAIEHTLSSDGTTITSTQLTFTTDLGSGHQVKAGFGAASLQSCTVTVNTAPTKDTATCTYSTAPSTSTATQFNVAVS